MRTITTEFVALTGEELRSLIWFNFRKRKKGMLLVSLIGLVVTAWAVGAGNPSLIGAGVGVTVLGPLDFLYVSWWINKLIRNPQNRALLEPARAIITEEEIAIETKDGKYSRFPWNTVIRVEPYRENFILYLSEFYLVAMFRRGQTAEDWTQFEAWVEVWRRGRPSPGPA